MWFKRYRKKYDDVTPEEIFLDSRNLPGFDTHQFEGRIERPLPRFTLLGTCAAFIVIGIIFSSKIFSLQISHGNEYFERSENNRLDHDILFAKRGPIYDRTGYAIAENESREGELNFAQRVYSPYKGLSHVLGYVKYPKKDANGYYYEEKITGAAGVESYYDELLQGENGARIIETDALGENISENLIRPAVEGETLTLSIDAELSDAYYRFMEELAERVGFTGGGGIIIDVHTGEILSLVSYPEFSASIMTEGSDREAIASYFENKKNPFLNRVIGGLYAPGSIIKPFMALGALDRNIIDPAHQIYSPGYIEVPNPYNPEEKTIFHDWKAHGWVNMRDAIAVSSNVYFFAVGGGYQNDRGIGISGIEHYAHAFRIGERTGIDIAGEVEGVVPNPKWKEKTFPDDPTWRVGDTYNTSIGQYGFQVTPIQMVRAVGTIANGGIFVEPHLRIQSEPASVGRLSISDEDLQIVREGMREGVLRGTAKGLDMGAVKIGAKTGTAELGSTKQKVNSWVMGFFPYENPRYAFATVMESGPATNLIGSVYVTRQLFDWMSIHRPEYFEMP